MIRTIILFGVVVLPLFLSSQIRICKVSKVTLDNKLAETSGLFGISDTLWSHNDSGNDPYLFAIDRKGHIIQSVLTSGMASDDWEDATSSEKHIFIGDIGNNRGKKDTLRINRIQTGLLTSAQGKAEIISFSYSDSLRKVNEYKRGNFDCEAMIYFNKSLILFSKNHHPGFTMVYRVPDIPGHYVINPVDSFLLEGEITSADFNSATGMLVFCGYRHYTPFLAIGHIDSQGKISITARKTLRRFKGRQIEAVLIDRENPQHLWMSSENSKFFRQKLISLYLH